MAPVNAPAPVEVRRFEPWMQAAFRRVVLLGLAEHWGAVDENLNPDLLDVATTYAGATVLVAFVEDELVGTAILLPTKDETGQIVRMSVVKTWRRRGVARQLLEALRLAGRELGLARLALETTATWEDARSFYESAGFVFTHVEDTAWGPEAHYEWSFT